MPVSSSAAERADFSGVRRLGLFGGSFDPVHVGHLHVARSAQRAFQLDHVVFVPAARPPHKPGRKLASQDDRARMLALAIAPEPRWSLSTLEFERSGPSYTIDTVRDLPWRLGLRDDVELYLVIGWDNLRDLERWREAQTLLARVQPVVIWRGEDDPALLEHLAGALGAELFTKLERGLLRLPPAPQSSTEMRERLARGEDPGPSLPPGVLEYIRARGIYALEPTPPN
jgi:nicotinate-nucleotide adenylyltransferase